MRLGQVDDVKDDAVGEIGPSGGPGDGKPFRCMYLRRWDTGNHQPVAGLGVRRNATQWRADDENVTTTIGRRLHAPVEPRLQSAGRHLQPRVRVARDASFKFGRCLSVVAYDVPRMTDSR